MKRQRWSWPIAAIAAGVLMPLPAWLAVPAFAAPASTPASATPAAAQGVETPAIAAALQQRLEAGGDRLRVNGSVLAAEPLRAFYASRQFRPLWVDEKGPNGHARELMQLIRDGAAEFERVPAASPKAGLKLDMIADSARGGAQTETERLAEIELAYNAALLNFARTLRSGRVQPSTVDAEYALTPPPFDPMATLISAPDLGALKAHLARLAPNDPTWLGLERALATTRHTAAGTTSWPALPEGPALKPGESSDLVPMVRRMLSAWGDYEGQPSSSKLYDSGLVQAMRRFQARHGLEPDGVIGSRSRAALNISPADRVAQILVNMERWRWMPRDLGDPHILVNMAGFELQAVESGRPPLTMRVVVGQPVRRTPVFSDEMTYIEFNPTWTVPKTIAVEDLLPKIRRNPGMLEAQGIRVLARGTDGAYAVDPAHVDWNAVGSGAFPFRLRQVPGPKNPLGRVKFMFPNDFSVYLHDTPKRELFARAQRAFSSGCIRVEKPVELAELLLEGTPGWGRERIDAVIEQGKTRTVTLASPVPVHLVYLTAWQDNDGKLQFREDLYGRDSRLLQFIFKNGV